MAANIELYAATGLWIDLNDGASYDVGGSQGGGLGAPSIEHIWSQPNSFFKQRLVGTKVSNRTVELPISVRGTSVDTWSVNYKLLARMIRDAQNGVTTWLRVKLNGETYATDYDVLSGDVPDAKYLKHTFSINYVTSYLPIRLYFSPWGRKTQLTRNSSTLNNGGGTGNTAATLSVTPDSERQTPLRLQLAGSDAIRGFIAGIRTRGTPANIPFPLHCETGSYTGYTVASIEDTSYTQSNQVVAGAQNGNVWRLVNAAGADVTDRVLRWTLTNPADWYGRWRPLLRIDSFSAAFIYVSLRMYYTGTDGVEVTLDQNASIALGDDHCIDMAPGSYIEFVEPPEGAIATSLVMELEVASNSIAGRSIDFDCLYMVPWDEWSCDVELSAALSAADINLLDNLSKLPGLTVLSSAGILQPEYATRFNPLPIPRLLWQPQLSNRLFVLTFESARNSTHQYLTHILTATIAATVDHYDLYDLIRGGT